MFRIKTILFAAIISVLSCKGTKETSEAEYESEVKKIEIAASTRGYAENLEVTPEVFRFSSTNDKVRERAIQEEEWQQILQSLERVDFSTISELKSPTENRFFDGDLATNVKIFTADSSYVSSSFDKKNPPATLQKLVEAIYKLKEKK